MKRSVRLVLTGAACWALGCNEGQAVSLGHSAAVVAEKLRDAQAEPPPTVDPEPPEPDPPIVEPPEPDPPVVEPPVVEPDPPVIPPDRDADWPPTFENVRLLASLSSDAKDDNPTLSADQLLLCFTSKRNFTQADGGVRDDVNIYCSERQRVTLPFSAPVPMTALNTPLFESSPALSASGLEMWWGSLRAGGKGGMDIWHALRADRDAKWTKIKPEAILNTEADDVPRPMGGPGNAYMPLASRIGGGNYRTFIAQRKDGAFLKPVLIAELGSDKRGAKDAFLDNSGLTLYFAQTTSDNPGNLYAARRQGIDENFGEIVALGGVNSPRDDRDPWLSADGNDLYFASDRDGVFNLYHAVRVR